MKPKPNRNRKIFQRTRTRGGARSTGARARCRHVASTRVADPLEDVATDVEAEVFHGSVVAVLVHARR